MHTTSDGRIVLLCVRTIFSTAAFYAVVCTKAPAGSLSIFVLKLPKFLEKLPQHRVSVSFGVPCDRGSRERRDLKALIPHASFHSAEGWFHDITVFSDAIKRSRLHIHWSYQRTLRIPDGRSGMPTRKCLKLGGGHRKPSLSMADSEV